MSHAAGRGLTPGAYGRWFADHPKVETRLTANERDRLRKVLQARQQTFRDWLVEQITQAETATPSGPRQRVRVVVEAHIAQIAEMACRERAEVLLSLAREHQADARAAITLRRAAGPWLDAASFFADVLRRYQAGARPAPAPASLATTQETGGPTAGSGTALATRATSRDVAAPRQ